MPLDQPKTGSVKISDVTGIEEKEGAILGVVFNSEDAYNGKGAPVRQIKEAAQRNGTRFLRDAALELFLEGHTTLDEVNRVTLVS